MPKNLLKMTFRSILSTKARFLSILMIILIGVGFFAGISATGPDMRQTANNYYQQTKLMDLRLLSTTGIDSQTLQTLKKQNSDIKQTALEKSQDAIVGNGGLILHFTQYRPNGLNQPWLIKGRFPKNSNEIALDAVPNVRQTYPLGHRLKLSGDNPTSVLNNFRYKTFKVVGYYHDPAYIETIDHGRTSVGKGRIDDLAVVSTTALKVPTYTAAYLTLKHMPTDAYSNAYTKKANNAASKIQTQFNTLSQQHYQQQVQQLKAAAAKLAAQQQQLAGYPATAVASQLAQLKTAQAKLNETQAVLQKPITYVQTRQDNPGFSEYKDNADRISSIATIFPVFFFLIAALVCLTTMTRMVDEDRAQIGTMKALGFFNREILLKYLVYTLLASLTGIFVGLTIGYQLFPRIIFNAYGSLYNLPKLSVQWYGLYSGISFVVSILCTMGAALLALRLDLRSDAATLMLPEPPKRGQHILLERWHWLWQHLNFMGKVTARNVFRYKQRMWMTIFGIAGCMALIITGIGLRDSITDIFNLQYRQIFTYQALVEYNPKATNTQTRKFNQIIDAATTSNNRLTASLASMDVKKSGMANQGATLVVPNSPKQLPHFITLRTRQTKQKLPLTNHGAVITEKLANLADVQPGNMLTIQNSDQQKFRIKITAITENYAAHYIYMTPAYYQKIFHQQTVANSLFLKYGRHSTHFEDNLATRLQKTGKASNVTFLKIVSSNFSQTLNSLNLVALVLVISAGLLAFVVLYNLTNINVAERLRELATLKVLGFYNGEVTLYIYRENFLLTFFGIILGLGFGKVLHHYVVKTAEIDVVMFSPTLHLASYLWGIVLTILFALIVMFMINRWMRKIDMLGLYPRRNNYFKAL